MKTIALTGSGGGQCAELADVLLDVPSRQTPRIQEAHAVVYHIICEMVERQMATG
jgi:D-sedoheptulose 7-phosphate isomerase